MDVLMKHLTDMVSIDGASWTLILLICGTAMWIVRDHMPNIGITILILPLMLGLSLLVNYAMILLEFFAANKMAEWLVWTIVAATIGTLGGISVIAVLARFMDREPA